MKLLGPKTIQLRLRRRSWNDAKDYRLRYEAAPARELSLLKELYEVKKKLATLTGDKVVPLRRSPSDKRG
jgi:hypothetical protein